MSRSVLLVTGGDAKYFELLRGAVRSIREKPEGRQVTLAVFDLGCGEDQLCWLRSQADFVRRADWDFEFPGREQLPEHFKSLLVRAVLPRYFPGFFLYLWMDADAWVQDWTGPELFLRGAQRRRGLAVVPELDRGNRRNYGDVPRIVAWHHRHYGQAYGKAVADRLSTYPMLNAGVFAMHRDAPHWEAWAQHLRAALQPGLPPMCDQLALNLATYQRDLFPRTELLPAWCNWTCHFGLPAWDRGRACLVEPYLPHQPIGILHLTGQDKHDRARLPTTDGGHQEVSLRYQPPAERKTFTAFVHAFGPSFPQG